MAVVLMRVHSSGRSFVAAYTSLRNVAAVSISANTQPQFESAKPFKDIPGPTPLPIPKVGNFWRFLPFGTFANHGLHELHSTLFKKYGSIVRLTGIGKSDLVFIYEPEDVEKVFRAEGSWPIRLGGDSLDYYRRHVRKDVYKKFRGVFTTDGDEWKANRTVLNQPMMRPPSLNIYHQRVQPIAMEFIKRMRELRDENLELPKDFRQELNRWAVEYIAFVSFETRFGGLDPNLPVDSDSNRLIKAAMNFFDYTYKLEVTPSLWEIYSTSDYRKMHKAQDTIVEITMRHVAKKLEEIKNRKEGDPEGLSVLETLLKEKGLDVAIAMVLDMTTAGVDTTANMTAIAMHHLASNPEVQEKLYQELKTRMPNKGDPVPEDYVVSLPYLKACQKESQRMFPIVAGNSRRIAKDIVLRGYKIPKGSNIICGQMVMCQREKNFTKANKFIPERWLKSSDGQQGLTKVPFAFLPFGFGPRMCIGRKFVDQQLDIILAMIFRNFKVSFKYGELEMETTLLRRPKTPLRFKIEEREN